MKKKVILLTSTLLIALSLNFGANFQTDVNNLSAKGVSVQYDPIEGDVG
ncbi:hypothetical protein ACFFGV_00705 [Pontibacillus salicampi]|uniref:Phr family secreted Rap phosphatase inhibitor n=1 Tax=Pontibacillus salicampi TaxID=1449801 RepID=A0ABV6LIA8_9BACI